MKLQIKRSTLAEWSDIIMNKEHETQSVDLSIMISSWKNKKPSICLPPNEVFVVEFSYPLGSTYTAKLDTGECGVSTIEIVNFICDVYKNTIYVNNKSIKKFEVFGHDLEDLILSGISVDFTNKVITMNIDS
jgi:hypothetical protein